MAMVTKRVSFYNKIAAIFPSLIPAVPISISLVFPPAHPAAVHHHKVRARGPVRPARRRPAHRRRRRRAAATVVVTNVHRNHGRHIRGHVHVAAAYPRAVRPKM